MIECTSEYIWYKKRKRIKLKRFTAFFLVFVFLFGSLLYYKFVVTSLVMNICSDYAYSYSTEAANTAVLFSLNNGVDYSDLILIQKNANGDISLMTANTQKINSIGRAVAETTSENLKSKLHNGVPIPLLAFTGIDILSGLGKNIYIKNINIISVISEFKSTFNSVGINQTLHSIYIDVITNVEIIFPLNKKTVKSSTSILIAETVLVGSVPEIYLNGKIFG